MDRCFNPATRSVNPCVFATTPPNPTTIAVLRIETPESAAPLLKILIHSVMPSIRLNIKSVASATPANTEVSTGKGCHGLLNNTKITMIGRTAMATCGRSGFSSSEGSSSSDNWYFKVLSKNPYPFLVKERARNSNQKKIIKNIAIAVNKDGTNAAVDGVPRLSIAITFCTEGEPGPLIDQVQHPAEMAAGIRRRVRFASLNRLSAIG